VEVAPTGEEGQSSNKKEKNQPGGESVLKRNRTSDLLGVFGKWVAVGKWGRLKLVGVRVIRKGLPKREVLGQQCG